MQLRRFLLTSLFATAACAFAVPAMSTEPYLEFVDGLRKREYFDYAMTYLEQLESRPNLPADIKEVIAYEKAVTLLEEAPTIKNPDQRSKHLDDAKLFLEQFLKSAAPDNPLRAQASTELAQVLVGKCRVEVLQSRSPNNLAQKPQFQTNARAFIGEARKVFQDANDKYEAAYKGYPVYIDKAKDKQIYEAREAALVSYIQAQLNLAIVTYEEAQCYDKTAPEFKQLLTKASEEFEKIHSKYRSQVAGLYARMWQGKCFEEQDDITKALGIYNELLGHPGESSAMRTLQDRVLYFRLICLNHDQRKDYQVVYQDGNDWMKGTPTQKKRSRIGLGIQWEMARGAEGLATKPDTPANEVERWAKIAMAIARTINAYPGEYKEVSAAMIQRLSILLKRDPSDPKDFDTAYGLARNLVNQISKLNEAITTVPPAERKKAQEALALHLDETARILRLGLTLATDKDEIADVNRARYFLSYVYYLMKDRSYDSAILGEFVATRYAEKLPEQALDAAYLAMASYAQAQAAAVAQLNSKATDEERAAAQDEDTERIVRICTFITTHWPTNDKANDARMRLGSLFSRNKKPAEAAKIYAEIPDTAPQYLEAQLAAGQAYWQSYIDAAYMPDEKRPPKEQLDEMQNKAKAILKAAIDKLESKAPKEGTPEENVTLAKFSLAQILNGSGDYKGALAMLADGPRAVAAAVAVAKEADRPARGVKSAPFASASYIEILRSYVGTQQLDEARSAMKELEKINAAGEGGANVMGIYLNLGKQLKSEVERLQAGKDPRLAEVLKSFETFLDDMYKRAAGQDYNALQWVAETYFALGEGLEERDRAKSAVYFEKAAGALQAILEQASKDPAFVPEAQLTGVQLRLVNCKRRQQEFEEAEKLVTEILKTRPNALDAQIEAAQVYQSWAARGGPDDANKWELAVRGNTSGKKNSGKVIWGWFDLAERLARSLDQGGPPNPDYAARYLEARYNVAYCDFKSALTQAKAEKKKQYLETAKRDILLTTALSEDLGGGESWDKFNSLYRDIQTEAGTIPVVDLEKRVRAEPSATKVASKPKPKKKTARVAAAPVAPPPPSGGGMGTAIVALVVLLVIGGGAGFFMMTGKKPKRAEPKPVTPAAAPPAKKKAAKAKA